MITPLIYSKLSIPELPDAHVQRPRVRSLLHDAIANHSVVSVSASAGSGKTVAVVDAALSLGHPVAWLNVDRSDVAPGRFLTYLDASVATVCSKSRDVAVRAAAAQIPHPEAAGLLAEAMEAENIVIILDNVERLANSEAAWEVINSFLRYTAATVVLIDRRPLPRHLLDLPVRPVVGVIGESDLAFDEAEAQAVLTRLGQAGKQDAAEVVAATGGWAAAVVFAPPDAVSQDAPLHGFLAEQVLGRLPPAVQHFLVSTALLDVVDTGSAAGLGIVDAHEHLAALRNLHLPATWDSRRTRLRCHPVFREFLVDRLSLRPPAELNRLHLCRARMLVSDGDDEAAVGLFLQTDAPEEAFEAARRAIATVIDRADIELAENWLHRFGAYEPLTAPAELTTARLAIWVIGDELGRGLELCDALQATGTRTRLARHSNHAALLMIWLYGLAGRLDDAIDVVNAASASPQIRAISYGLSLMDPTRSFDRPALTGEPVDAWVLESDYFRGRLADCMRPLESPWAEAVIGPYSIGALRASGQTQRALDAFHGYASRLGRLPLQSFIGPDVLLDAGLISEARACVAEGEQLARSAGAPIYEALANILQAKIAARHDHDSRTTHEIFERLSGLPELQQSWCVRDMADVWRCLALLQDERDEDAAENLRRIVSTMVSVGGVLELPTAAVYLAEAEWRLGHEERADRAADVAMEAARRQGSNHLLLQALSDFPAVASRRLDADADPSSPWHNVGRQLSVSGNRVSSPQVGAEIVFHDLGPPTVYVLGEAVRPRIGKCHELLAFLLKQPDRRASRDLLLKTLFAGRRDDASRTYLRQVLRWLKVLVRSPTAVVADRTFVRLACELSVRSESLRFETMVAEAGKLHGTPRINGLTEALRMANRGEFLDGFDSAWVTERRNELRGLRTEAQFELASSLHEMGRLQEALQHLQAALSAEPLLENGWRLLMRINSELGAYDAVFTAFQQCEEALAGIGATASPATRKLLKDFAP